MTLITRRLFPSDQGHPDVEFHLISLSSFTPARLLAVTAGERFSKPGGEAEEEGAASQASQEQASTEAHGAEARGWRRSGELNTDTCFSKIVLFCFFFKT